MDLAYLKSHPEHLPTFLTHQRIRETPVSGGSICAARRLTLEDGSSVFAKSMERGAPEHFFTTEAAGLAWLGEAGATGGAPVPALIAALPELLVLEWVEPGEPTPAAAERFGRELAHTHGAGAERFGAPWPGFIGSLPQDNTTDDRAWSTWFAERRLEPYLRIVRDSGVLASAEVQEVEATLLKMPIVDEPPARIHGDLWPGNLLWAAEGRVWLVDPAAHGGHRETDLAQLALFGGVPFLGRILDSYQEVAPLAPGWRERIAWHQSHLLLVHAASFGSAYREAVLRAIRSLG